MRLPSLLCLLLVALTLSSGTAAAVRTPEEEKVEAVEEDVPTHTADEIKEAEEEFISIDANGDGFITEDEILAMEEVPERDEINEFFDTYDLDKDSKVSFHEILQADEAMRGENQEPLEEAHEHY